METQSLEGQCVDCGVQARTGYGRCDECRRAWWRDKNGPRSQAQRYDWVVVDRVWRGREPGRPLAPQEKVEVVRLILRSQIPVTNLHALRVMRKRTVERWVAEHKDAALRVGLERSMRFSLGDSSPVAELVSTS